MSLKNTNHINDATWQKLLKQLKLLLVWFPTLCVLQVGITWAMIGNLSWSFVIMILWLFPYVLIILFSRRWLTRSKFTLFSLFLMMSSFEMFFIIMSSACIYRFYGISGLWIQNLILLAAGIFVCRYYYSYWDRVWISHENYNETIALDLQNGRYDFLKNFDVSEDKINKSMKKYSNQALVYIAATVAPIGAAIPLIFSKTGDYTTPLIIVWILSVPFILGWLKMVVAPFHLFKKLSYYERKIGKPIINGLLSESGHK